MLKKPSPEAIRPPRGGRQLSVATYLNRTAHAQIVSQYRRACDRRPVTVASCRGGHMNGAIEAPPFEDRGPSWTPRYDACLAKTSTPLRPRRPGNTSHASEADLPT